MTVRVTTAFTYWSLSISNWCNTGFSEGPKCVDFWITWFFLSFWYPVCSLILVLITVCMYARVQRGVSLFGCMWSLETHFTISIRHPAAKSLAWQQMTQWQPPTAHMWFKKYFSWGGSLRHAWIIYWGRDGGVVFVKWYTGWPTHSQLPLEFPH